MSTSSSRLVTAPPATVVGVERWRRERSKLRRELGRLDAVCLLIAAIVVLDTLGAVARGGPQTITWLAIVAAMFFLPAGAGHRRARRRRPLPGRPVRLGAVAIFAAHPLPNGDERAATVFDEFEWLRWFGLPHVCLTPTRAD
jgi:hypothetical protein